MTSKDIATTIRMRRKQLRLTQEELASLASCSKPTVIAAEAGKPTMRLDMLLSLLDVLGLKLAIESTERR